MVKVWILRCQFQNRLGSGPPEQAVQKMGFGGKYLGRRTGRDTPAGKAEFREFGTAGAFSQRPMALTIDQRIGTPRAHIAGRGRRPSPGRPHGRPDPIIKSPVPIGGRSERKARSTKFFNLKVPEPGIQEERPSAVGSRGTGGSGGPATGSAGVAFRRSGFLRRMGRLFQPKTQNSKPKTENRDPAPAGSTARRGRRDRDKRRPSRRDRRARD